MKTCNIRKTVGYSEIVPRKDVVSIEKLSIRNLHRNFTFSDDKKLHM